MKQEANQTRCHAIVGRTAQNHLVEDKHTGDWRNTTHWDFCCYV